MFTKQRLLPPTAIREDRSSCGPLPTEARAVVRLIRSAGARVHVAFEEGTQAQWLHDVVAPHAERVIVCNTRGESEGGNRNDRLDADRLSERLRLGSLKSVFHG